MDNTKTTIDLRKAVAAIHGLMGEGEGCVGSDYLFPLLCILAQPKHKGATEYTEGQGEAYQEAPGLLRAMQELAPGLEPATLALAELSPPQNTGRLMTRYAVKLIGDHGRREYVRLFGFKTKRERDAFAQSRNRFETDTAFYTDMSARLAHEIFGADAVAKARAEAWA